MPVSAVGTISGLYRYPVKGLTPERLQTVHVDRGATLPFDRAYAIENGPAKFDPAAPKYLPKVNFVMLMRNEQLASVRSYFDDTSHTLTLSKDGREIARGNLQDAGGRSRIEAVVADLAGPSLRGAPRIVAAPGHSFSDVSAKCLHIVNLQSVRALEAAMGVAINPLRFRSNVIVDDWPAWSEFNTRREFASRKRHAQRFQAHGALCGNQRRSQQRRSRSQNSIISIPYLWPQRFRRLRARKVCGRDQDRRSYRTRRMT